MKNTATLIYEIPALSPDLMWAIHFDTPDAVLFIEHRGTKYLLLSPLEVDRGKLQSTADVVTGLGDYRPKQSKGRAKITDIIAQFCKTHKISSLRVHHTQSVGIVDALRKKRIKIEISDDALFPQRMIKDAHEFKIMRKAQQTTFGAMAMAEQILQESRIRKGQLYWKSEVLTSDRLRAEVSAWLLHQGFLTPTEVIVAGGMQSTDPHHRGEGPLRPHESIIIDIFPQDAKTFYFGDATRTFCKGKAPTALRNMYNTVKREQVKAIKSIKAGINSRRIHTAITKGFAQAGYQTGEKDGFMQGFIHGTGHGIGLALHEEPVRISSVDFKLKPGHMVTVEPGLYYRDIGGVRIEDTVYVTKDGCKVLGSYRKKLEIE